MNTRLLRHGLKFAHLQLLALLAETERLGDAADALGIAQPAASRLLSEAERIVGCGLRLRDGRGIRLTPEGEALARRAARILTELHDAEREIGEIGSGLSGDVRIGSVTGPAMERVLPLLRSARHVLPKLRIHVEVANSEVLGEALLDGRMDLALARPPRGHPAGLFDFTPICEEPVVLGVRRGHPLLSRATITYDDLLAHDWVLPERGTILHDTVQERLARLGLPAPEVKVTTSSSLLTLALVQRSDAIAPLAVAVAEEFAGEACAILPIDLGISVAPFGLITRADAALTTGAQKLREMLMQNAAAPEAMRTARG